MDMNDRALRDIVVGLGGAANGFAREAGFDITVASEVMAILCLATDLEDLEARRARVVVARTRSGTLVTARAPTAGGAMTVPLRDESLPTPSNRQGVLGGEVGCDGGKLGGR